MNNIYDLLNTEFDISKEVLDAVYKAEEDVSGLFAECDRIAEYNQYKVLKAFQKYRVSMRHFAWNTGYGYDDKGREVIENIYADVFHTEAAIVRPLIVNGTHALALTLQGILRPGDELIYCSGQPYDTLEEVIGIRGEDGNGSLKEYGITYKQVELTADGKIDTEALKAAISDSTRVVAMQRSTGYGWRKALTIKEIGEVASFIKSINPDIVVMADNCYGEFMDTLEPTDVGVDVIAGSLIKNPGGGLAVAGGYIAGKQELIDKIMYRMTCPGIGGECGLTFGQSRSMLQGFFIAPHVATGARKGAILCGQVFKNLGFEVCPEPADPRSDIIQAVKLGNPDAVVAFCQGIQAAAPVDSFVRPEPCEMPGYEDAVVMAAGAFILGSSIELSADAPLREPYCVYFQGGLTYEHSKFGVIKALQAISDRGLVTF